MTLRDGEGGGRGGSGWGTHVHPGFMSLYGENRYNIVISLQLNNLKNIHLHKKIKIYVEYHLKKKKAQGFTLDSWTAGQKMGVLTSFPHVP